MGSNTTKRVNKSSGPHGSLEEHETRARALTSLLEPALDAVKHHEEGDFPKKSECTALIPLATKMATVYEPCSKLIRQTELMKGLGDTYSENYDIRPPRKESLLDWFTKVLYRLEWCDLQDVEGVMSILETCE